MGKLKLECASRARELSLKWLVCQGRKEKPRTISIPTSKDHECDSTCIAVWQAGKCFLILTVFLDLCERPPSFHWTSKSQEMTGTERNTSNLVEWYKVRNTCETLCRIFSEYLSFSEGLKSNVRWTRESLRGRKRNTSFTHSRHNLFCFWPIR